MMFIHTNHEEVIELPTDRNGVPSLHVCPTRQIASPMGLKKQGYKQITKCSA